MSLPASTTRTEAADPGFAVYVHWPFCQAKCPYCDFNSHVRAGGIDEPRFLQGYLAELDHMAELTGAREVNSVFFGGGTPSLMDPKIVDAILARIARDWTLAGEVEITLEANPTSVEAGRFAGYRSAGVNRVSLGVQALDDRALRALGRLHTADEAMAALAVARERFDRVSFDMIYARPGQGIEDWRRELQTVLTFDPGHLSLYQLTIEAGTPFAALHAAGKLAVPDEDAAHDLYLATQQLCDGAGLYAYEVSNHARPGEECRHNLVYWRGGEWAGVGPGAHGRVGAGGRWLATSTLNSPEAWLSAAEDRGDGIETSAPVGDRERAEEYLLMGLRLSEGIDLARFAALGGRINDEKIAVLERDGLLSVQSGCLAATQAGRLVLNAVIAELAA